MPLNGTEVVESIEGAGLVLGGWNEVMNNPPLGTHVPAPNDLFPSRCDCSVIRVYVYPHFVPGYDVERSRRRGRSTRRGTNFVPGYKMRVQMFLRVPQRPPAPTFLMTYSAPCSHAYVFEGTGVYPVPGS